MRESYWILFLIQSRVNKKEYSEQLILVIVLAVI